MFNKGKAFLLSVLGSIALMAIFIPTILPVHKIFHFSSALMGWHSVIGICVLCYFMFKYQKDEKYKIIKKVLLADFVLYVLFAPIGIQKSIYDIQKFKAQKEKLTATKGTGFCIFAWLLYVVYILPFVLVFAVGILGPGKFIRTGFEMQQERIYSDCLNDNNELGNKEEYCHCMIDSITDSLNQEIKRMEDDNEQGVAHHFDRQKWEMDATQKAVGYCRRLILKNNFKTQQEQIYSGCLKGVKDNEVTNKEKFCQCMVDSLEGSMDQVIEQMEDDDRQEKDHNFDRQKWETEATQKMNEDCKEFILQKNDQ